MKHQVTWQEVLAVAEQLHVNQDIITARNVTEIIRSNWGLQISVRTISRLCLAAESHGRLERVISRPGSFRVVDAAVKVMNEMHTSAVQVAALLGGRAVNGLVVLDFDQAKLLAVRLSLVK